jgi:hypothetical protein
METFTVTKDSLAVLFTEWLDRYNADPSEFREYGDSLAYGECCSSYIIELNGEVA